jgi:hypothetical protein
LGKVKVPTPISVVTHVSASSASVGEFRHTTCTYLGRHLRLAHESSRLAPSPLIVVTMWTACTMIPIGSEPGVVSYSRGSRRRAPLALGRRGCGGDDRGRL